MVLFFYGYDILKDKVKFKEIVSVYVYVSDVNVYLKRIRSTCYVVYKKSLKLSMII